MMSWNAGTALAFILWLLLGVLVFAFILTVVVRMFWNRAPKIAAGMARKMSEVEKAVEETLKKP